MQAFKGNNYIVNQDLKMRVASFQFSEGTLPPVGISGRSNEKLMESQTPSESLASAEQRYIQMCLGLSLLVFIWLFYVALLFLPYIVLCCLGRQDIS